MKIIKITKRLREILSFVDAERQTILFDLKDVKLQLQSS